MYLRTLFLLWVGVCQEEREFSYMSTIPLTPIHDIKSSSGVESTHKKQPLGCIVFVGFMLGEWEVCSYATSSSSIEFALCQELHHDLRNVTLRYVTPSLISQNLEEQMCSIWISLMVVTLPSHISHISTSKWSTKEFKPLVHMRRFGVRFVLHWRNPINLSSLLRSTLPFVYGWVCYLSILHILTFVFFHNITYYANSPLSCIHVYITDLLDVRCTLVATSMK